jgi:hypothetical protein
VVKPMKIVAFLQNMWVRNPEAARRILRRSPEVRERLIAYALFAGCLTGRRLKAALGEDLCQSIVWEEASRVISDNPKDYHAPDAEHIKAVLAKHRPEVVLCFSRGAEKVIRQLCSCRMISAPHPATRLKDIVARLQAVGYALRAIEEQKMVNAVFTRLDANV